ncbi:MULTISPECIES: bifunctional phosphoribosylaminoimidazolecarboxamide formyltransferase/IMP cyclohydrolase [Actinomycetaceae]|jgi:phosphoribosylaminoimidazolecarboxamide formyltransferase/IMP cyclohydrolase|uniref:bifunctional phosphoribosylaminoimidazolecarboxamide formyltransferase/IMP cyclohydrolase n=1 Tax=Actinomycetaceae TaxID=2049 RepID=UPI0003980AC6|nr:bifunctional phosphoribosylaminoimidazolecarboxamide formyltransferase/IMP cyclohydrolase [Actinobaculum sp. oral taxon 183]ERH17522.1 phosphoribosylaminoimidazolecarboxamide formyltransferase/IMP cyclohydrolase [Actinobaculum sp. oral taxon 183 str. F0552]
MRIPLRRAIVSVSDKTGVEELARALDEAGCRIVSTGTTASAISEAGIPVTEVSALTGFPECLDGRVKTLHPAVYAGILADRRKESHVRQLADLGIAAFDLVVVNLYPFRQAVASGAGFEECVEKIDIGGPAMVRAAAKNHASVAVVTDPADYGAVIEAAGKGGFEDGERLRLAAKAFAHTAAYDAAVAEWISEGECAGGVFTRRSTLRYGENPHQAAAVYTDGTGGLAQAEQLGGKEMSYNNYQDVDAALRAAYDHAGPAVAVVKHANPCGLAVGEDVADAYRRAHACDPVSAYGGVIAANREVSADMAEAVAGVFTEAIAAPGFAPEALDILSRKKNLRILRVGELDPTRDVRPISGGILLQDRDLIDAPGDDPASWTLVSGDPADGPALRDLEFAWRAVRAVKSNAILLARDGASVGIGMGQVNRVDSCRLAVTRAGDRAAGAVAASDAYFPFADGFEVLARAGVRAVVQPGGSIRDEEVISSARASSVTMYLTGTRHFAH